MTILVTIKTLHLFQIFIIIIGLIGHWSYIFVNKISSFFLEIGLFFVQKTFDDLSIWSSTWFSL